MRYTTIPSDKSVAAAGLPHSVATITPRETVAAFKEERVAIKFCKQLNGTVDAETEARQGENLAERMPESPPKTIEVGASNQHKPDQRSLAEKVADAQKGAGS